jgi:mycobactin lysine-N-oxygenase
MSGERATAGTVSGETGEADLLIVGAGAKAAAIAAKVHALNTLDLGPVSLTIVEATEPAASWSGRNGMTSGEEPLAITPIKDVGFPYQSFEAFGEAGDEIDRAVMPFCWQQYMIEERGYARWVNAGSPSIQHRTYGRYLAWVLSRATEGVSIVRGRVARVSLQDHPGGWAIDVADCTGPPRHRCRALALTGPGIHRPIPHDPDIAPRIFHCDSRRIELARIPIDESSDIAIVGGGESALSSAVFLRAFRPDARLTIYTPTLPLSRGESFLENRVFSNPDEVFWSTLDVQTRRDFVKHCDRGVFDPGTLEAIAYDEHFQFVTGRVRHIASADRGGGVRVDFDSAEGPAGVPHDYVVNCTGFDLLEQLRSLFPPVVREEIERQVGPLWDRPPQAEVSIGRHLELDGMDPRLFIPGLSGLSQGPGFANLGCLGLLANRVLEPIVQDAGDLRRAGHAGHAGHAGVVEVR